LTVTAQTTTLGNYLINEIGNHVANISGVSNGAHFFFIPLAGISTSLLTDAQIPDMLTIDYYADGISNNGATQGSIIDKNNWVIDRVNNRIRVNYSIYNDAKADTFTIKKNSSTASVFSFAVSGINF
jgi:hypothetical protein